MPQLPRMISIAVFIAIGAAFSASNPSKVGQCNKMVDVGNRATAVGNELTQAFQSKDSDRIISALTTADDKINAMSRDMQALDIKDAKLKTLRQRFVTNYQDYTTIMGNLKVAAQTNNTSEFYQVQERSKIADTTEKALIVDVNSYCSSK